MTSNWIEVKTDQGEQWSRDFKRGALPRHCLCLTKPMKTRPYLIAVNPTALRAELKKRGLNTNMLAALSGCASRKTINDMLLKNGVTESVADVLTRLGIAF